MSKRIPLEALLRRVSRMAEQKFDKQGNIDPIWLVENAEGEQQVIVSPIVAPSPLAAHAVKGQIADKMRKLFAENNVVRFAHATEAWALEQPVVTEEWDAMRYAAMGYTLANHPDRREVVQIHAEDDAEALHALRDIIRPAHGKPYLGKLGPIERMEQVESRWAGLLPNAAHDAARRERPVDPAPQRVRFSHELPDDVGTVFMTAVPGAPIQIIGRRDPATGELCPGSIVRAPEDVGTSLPPVPDDVEAVTGPEAERLILAVHHWLSEQAEAEGMSFDEYAAKHEQAMRQSISIDSTIPLDQSTVDSFSTEIRELTKEYPDYCEGVRILAGIECYFTYRVEPDRIVVTVVPRDQAEAILNEIGLSTHEPWSPLPGRTDQAWGNADPHGGPKGTNRR
jgi:hypothetical protein